MAKRQNLSVARWVVARPITTVEGTGLAILTVLGLVACGGDVRVSVMPPDRCTALSSMELIDFRITDSRQVRAEGAEPGHCRVHGVIDTEINFELLLPDDWNGRFVMGGGGGYVGTVQNAALGYGEGPGALERGYATVGTDTGHAGTGIEANWALGHDERQVNFGHRAVHLTAEAARSVVRHYYGRHEDFSYFVGCSRGGGQGMMESQRYPDDFDGIVAGAPAYHWTAFTAGFVQTQQKIFPDPSYLDTPVITSENRILLHEAILEACDALDGVSDGVLTDPRACRFTPDSLPRCENDVAGADCLTPEQLAAINAIYGGPLSRGVSIFPGFPFGGENEVGGWDRWIAGADLWAERGVPNLHYGFGTELYKHFVFDDPDWDYTRYDFSTWAEDVAETAAILDATDTELGPFRDSGGKLILWTGWSDSAITALGTIGYYEDVEAGDAAVREYSRLFMLPGVLHCGGGRGPDSVDWLTAIENWVERDRPPERLIATRRNFDGESMLTRPVCPYPEVARYDGAGSTDDAGSFRCAMP